MIAIILVVLIFGLLVFIHEFGHFITARKGGIAVEEFGFGFPPRIFGVKRGETLYSLNLIPFGGFVKMRGENGEDTTPGSFGGASFGRKVAVLLAGVIMNLLVAYALFVYLAATGLPGSVKDDLNLPAGNQSIARVTVLEEANDSPAYNAGIRKGDVILGVASGIQSAGANPRFETEQQLVDFNKRHAGESVTYRVSRQGMERDVAVQLRDAAEGEKSGYIGVTPLALSNVSYGWQAPWVAAVATVKTVWLTVTGFVGAVTGLFIHQQVSNAVTGPVGVTVILGNLLYLGANYVLFFVATISISLAALNVLPIPALDGGRAAVLLIGKFMGRPVPAKVEGVIHTVGFVLLLLFMVIVTIVDIKRF